MSEHEKLYPAYAHSALALDTIAHHQADKAAGHPEVVGAPATEAEAQPRSAA